MLRNIKQLYGDTLGTAEGEIVITTGFTAKKTLTKDTAPVDVDAVLFCKVVDPKQAAVAVSDYQIAEKFAEAAKAYEHNPVAFHLRAMNMLYEGLKQNATIVIVPSTAVESMQLGGLAGMTALTMGLGQDRANGQKAAEPGCDARI